MFTQKVINQLQYLTFNRKTLENWYHLSGHAIRRRWKPRKSWNGSGLGWQVIKITGWQVIKL